MTAAWDLGYRYAEHASIIPTKSEIMGRWNLPARQVPLFCLGCLARWGQPFPPHFRELMEWHCRSPRSRLDRIIVRVMSVPLDADVLVELEKAGLDDLGSVHSWSDFMRRWRSRLRGG